MKKTRKLCEGNKLLLICGTDSSSKSVFMRDEYRAQEYCIYVLSKIAGGRVCFKWNVYRFIILYTIYSWMSNYFHIYLISITR